MGARGVLLLGLFATASVAQPLTTVAIELKGLPEEDWKTLELLSLEKQLVLRLVQDGFAVVAAQPDVRVKLERRGDQLQLSAQSRSRELVELISVGERTNGELHLELVQRATELSRRCAPAPVVAMVVTPPPRPRPEVETPPSRSPGVTVAGALGFVTRAGGSDASVHAALRVGKRIGGELTVGLLPSGNASVTVMELPVLLAFSLRFELGLGFSLEAALGGGVLVHTFFGSSSGAAVDALGSLPLTLSWTPLPWLGLGVRVAPSVVSGVHAESGWSRGAWWFEASGLAFLRI